MPTWRTREIQGRRSRTVVVAQGGDTSGGREAQLGPFSKWTLNLQTFGAIDLTIEISPDGSNFFEINESPIVFSSASEQTFELGYTAGSIRITGSNSTGVIALIRGLV